MSQIAIQKAVALAPYTTFKVGGQAAYFVEVQNSAELVDVLQSDAAKNMAVHILSFGSNTLVSDNGFDGLVICVRGGAIEHTGTQLVADAGVWWDDVVQAASAHGLWGVECMSLIPGSIGAATYINITAYGQSIGPLVEWVEVWDPATQSVQKLDRSALSWDYKESIFQNAYSDAVILQVCLQLSPQPTDELTYQGAIDAAHDIDADIHTLAGRRDAIIEARRRADSIWQPDNPDSPRTAGSFFRNPLVDESQVSTLIAHDETGRTAEQISKMNQVHGGTSKRVSSAHVMLAAGFSRGQQWGNVKLNDKNLLKIEALDGATAQEVYDVAQHIIQICQSALGITLQPEAVFLGDF